MDRTHRRIAALSGMAGAALLAAGPVMLLRGGMGRKQIRTELAAQKIKFPDHGLPPELASYAGRQVETGPTAYAYAELIKDHLAHATGGRTYSEISNELMADKGGKDGQNGQDGQDGQDGEDKEKLSELRQTAFMGETLRGSLLSAYQAWHLTSLVMGLGGLLTGLGAALAGTANALKKGTGCR